MAKSVAMNMNVVQISCSSFTALFITQFLKYIVTPNEQDRETQTSVGIAQYYCIPLIIDFLYLIECCGFELIA